MFLLIFACLVNAQRILGETLTKPEAKAPKQAAKLDRSGKKQRGQASYYNQRLAGKPMADGTPMDPESNAAASKTLPLGTRAKVTNLRNGRSAVVEIKDRGPYVSGRTIDLTSRTARDLGMTKDGVAPVEVAPLEVPQADGGRLQVGAASEFGG